MSTLLKQSPLGEIPKEWEVVRLDEVAEINKETRDPTREQDKKFIYIDIESVQNGSGLITNFKEFLGKNAPSRARKVIHKNDIIMSMVRPYLKAFALVKKEFDNQICSTGFAVFTCKTNIEPMYLLHNLFSNFVINQCNKMMVGGQYPALNESQVSRIKIPLPSLEEQKAIVTILSTVDESIQKSEEIIEKTDRIKKAMINRLLTKGIGKNELKEVKIGLRKYNVPKDWEVNNLADTSTLKGRIGWQGLTTKEYLKKGEYYLVTGTDFKDGKIEWCSCVYVNKERYDQDTNIQLKEKDLLITKDGSIGKIAFVERLPGKGTLNSGVFVIRPTNNSYLPKYMYWIMNSKFFDSFMHKTAGSTIAHLYQRDFINFEFPLPPIEEQQKISEILSAVDEKLELERKRKGKLERVKKGLMGCLLTGKKRIQGG